MAALDGRRVLVTGGSRGIGAATVRELHAQGAFVVIHYNAGRDVAEQLASELGARTALVTGDLSDAAAAPAVWDAAVEAAGTIDVLVNNAGAWLSSRLDDADDWDAGWERNIALNLRSPAELCRSAVQHYRARGGGIIVNVTSRSAHRGDDVDHLAYGAAKGGLLALTRGLARALARENVLAFAVSPGWVATDLAASEDLTALAAHLPMGEVTPPEDVAAVIAFLAAGTARHATGTTIDITGADYVR
jgi:3-oxoacyl-[acyl-carrier protein] reductase